LHSIICNISQKVINILLVKQKYCLSNHHQMIFTKCYKNLLKYYSIIPSCIFSTVSLSTTIVMLQVTHASLTQISLKVTLYSLKWYVVLWQIIHYNLLQKNWFLFNKMNNIVCDGIFVLMVYVMSLLIIEWYISSQIFCDIYFCNCNNISI